MRSRFLAALLLASSFLLVAGKKEARTEVEAQLAGHPTERVSLAAPTVLHPMQWEPGQWTLYRNTDKKGRVSVERLSIVSKEACGYQIESIKWSEQGKSGSQLCYAEMPVAWTVDEAVEEGMALVQSMTTWSDDSNPLTIDFTTPEGLMMRGMMQGLGPGLLSPLQLELTPTDETATVPAGSFAGAVRVDGELQIGPLKITSESRVHPGVPVLGNVWVESSDGTRSELVDFGLTGAVSERP
jgi:hypothetical protein